MLKKLDYGETSQIITVLTRESGRVSLHARGARLPTSAFGSTLQPLSYIQVVYYEKPGRSLHLLKEASHVRRFTNLMHSMNRLTPGFRLLELTHLLTEEGAAHPQVFNLLLQLLDRLDTHEGYLENLPLYFMVRMASLLGFHPHIRREDVLALQERGSFHLGHGRIHPEEHPGPDRLPASRGALRALAVLALADLDTVLRMHLTPACFAEVESLIHAYLRYHLEHLPPLRSSRVAEQMQHYLHRGR